MKRYKLPGEVQQLVHARNALRRRYKASGLSFTPDGNLVGDLGEAVAAELFGLALEERGKEGIDAKAPDGRTVQIKASGRGDSLAFTHTDQPADLLIGLIFHYEDEEVEVVYNGPYAKAISEFPAEWRGQKSKATSKLRAWNQNVNETERLVAIDPA